MEHNSQDAFQRGVVFYATRAAGEALAEIDENSRAVQQALHALPCPMFIREDGLLEWHVHDLIAAQRVLSPDPSDTRVEEDVGVELLPLLWLARRFLRDALEELGLDPVPNHPPLPRPAIG